MLPRAVASSNLRSRNVGCEGLLDWMLWDTLVVYGQNYSGSTGPVGVEPDGEISCFFFFFSDGAGQKKVGLGTPT